MAETSTKPYLIRAIHEWCSDNGFTPYIAVAVDSRTVVPREFVRNGEIVLNVSMLATHRLKLGNDLIEFQARFGGTPRELSIPVENVSAIYARENGHGMAFEVPKAAAVTEADAPRQPPQLAPVQGGLDSDEADEPADAARPPGAGPSGLAPSSDAAADAGPAEGGTPARESPRTEPALAPVPNPERVRGRPALRPAGGGRGEGKGDPKEGRNAEGRKGGGRAKQVLAVVPDSSEQKSPPAEPRTAQGSDAPGDPDDNPPRPSPPRLTRIK